MKTEEAGKVSDITVLVSKFDGSLHRKWRAHLARREGALLVMDAVFEEEVEHTQIGLIRRGTVSREYYWLDRWYNVFRFINEDRSLRSFYCNVNLPPVFDGRTLKYVDLDVDVLVAPDLSYQILDLDEFEQNAEEFNYPAAVRAGARRALDELLGLIELRRFPFDGHI